LLAGYLIEYRPNKRLFHALQRIIHGARITLYPAATPKSCCLALTP